MRQQLEEAVETAYALSKKDLSQYRAIRSPRVRHAGVNEDEEGNITYSFNYILVKNGTSSTPVNARCTKEVFQKVFGKLKAEDSVPVGGYATATGLNFILFENKETKLIEAIAAHPAVLQGSRNGRMPQEMEHIRQIEFIFHPGGSFEVASDHNPDKGLTIFKVPFRVTKQNLDKTIAAIIPAKGFNPGDAVGPYSVASVVGNKLLIDV
jgi:hypothetical protein